MTEFTKNKMYWCKSLQRAISFNDFVGIGKAVVTDEDKRIHIVSITDLFEL